MHKERYQFNTLTFFQNVKYIGGDPYTLILTFNLILV
jgi:hypothetical protein